MGISEALAALRTNEFQWLKMADKKGAVRLATALVNRGWWFAHSHATGDIYIIVSSAVDLERDIARKFPNLKFEVE